MKLPDWTGEPLVHFLAAGAGLFLLFAWIGEDPDPASRKIDVSEEDRARLSLQWQRTMSRPPTDAELDMLTEQYVREEILYREALRLGLDQDDAVVRKRMAVKMDYIAASMAETAQPSDDTLRAWLRAHPERFAADAQFDFDQLYFADKGRARQALDKLDKGVPEKGWDNLADPISLDATYDGLQAQAVEAKFGRTFLTALSNTDVTSQWSGPIPSGYGWHLVRLRGKHTGTTPEFDTIRQQVENDWRSSTVKQRKDQAYQTLRDGYDVNIAR